MTISGQYDFLLKSDMTANPRDSNISSTTVTKVQWRNRPSPQIPSTAINNDAMTINATVKAPDARRFPKVPSLHIVTHSKGTNAKISDSGNSKMVVCILKWSGHCLLLIITCEFTHFLSTTKLGQML